jgi:hypothetical protein
MTRLTDWLLSLPVFAEDALFVGFVLPGETAWQVRRRSARRTDQSGRRS